MLKNKLDNVLVADIGGTNARFAVAIFDNDSMQYEISNQVTFRCEKFSTFQNALENYLQDVDVGRIFYGCIAIAAPITGDHIAMTNLNWSFDKKEICNQFNFSHLLFINDFGAKAYATLHLPENDILLVREGEKMAASPRLILGPGTGLGVAGLVNHSNKWYPICGEGGHVSFSPATKKELEIKNILCGYRGHISVEKLVSGGGLENIYSALMVINGVSTPSLKAHEISLNAVEGQDEACSEAVNIFLSVLGGMAADAALTLGAFGGVYLGGGILPRIQSIIPRSDFFTTFNNKGRMQPLLENIPIFLLVGKNPSLFGAAYYLRDALMKSSR